MSSLKRVPMIAVACLSIAIAAFAQQPQSSKVPAPKQIVVSALPDLENWSVIVASDDPIPHLDFIVDLDMLAPLGTGDGNAATYFAHFTKPGGDRFAELEKATTTEVENVGKVYRADDPLLLEAQPWTEVATMNFYPNVYAAQGMSPQIPNLFHMMTLGRSWVARAQATTDRDAAKQDYRRTIRLGRLLRQDSVTGIQDLVGIALIRMGTGGLYKIARAEGDSATMTVCAMVNSQASMLREAIRTSLVKTSVHAREQLSDAKVERIARAARESGLRMMRTEALRSLYVVASGHVKGNREKARAAIATIASDSDPIVASMAKWYQSAKWTAEYDSLLPSE